MKEKLLARKLPEADSFTIDPENYYRQAVCGYYDFCCRVSRDKVRTAKFYIPDGSEYNQPTIFIGVPASYETDRFLLESGWKDLADKNHFYLVMMEAENGSWGDDESEIAYINALREDVNYRPFASAFSSKFYIFAYGETAAIIGRQIRLFPRSWAGAALIGESGMDEEELSMMNTKLTNVPGVLYSQVQMPVWISCRDDDESLLREIGYYRAVNHSTDTPECIDGRWIWKPKAGGTVDEHWCALTVHDDRDWRDCLSAEYSESIWNMVFSGTARYPGNANGALRRYPSIEERGFMKFSRMVAGGYLADGSDEYQRVWWVYKPRSVDDSEPFPLLFVFHGAGGSGDEIADRMGWAETAEEYGFMIICPTASLPNRIRSVSDIVVNERFRAMWNTGNAQRNRPSDMLFVDYLYRWAAENFSIDRSRVYASGQSSGGMMSWACACYRPDIFAAAAPFSAKILNMEGEALPFVTGSVMPVIASMGLDDNIFPGGFGTDDARMLIEHWHDAFALRENWNSYTYNDGGKNCSFKSGSAINYLFHSASGTPILRCVEMETKTHATWPSECRVAWTEFLSHFSKDPCTKKLYYNGKEV